jgi:hypothetical protein
MYDPRTVILYMSHTRCAIVQPGFQSFIRLCSRARIDWFFPLSSPHHILALPLRCQVGFAHIYCRPVLIVSLDRHDFERVQHDSTKEHLESSTFPQHGRTACSHPSLHHTTHRWVTNKDDCTCTAVLSPRLSRGCVCCGIGQSFQQCIDML